MYSYYKLRCKDCNDIIEIEYDTRKQPKSEWKYCKCKKLQACASYYSFSYHEDSDYERLESKYEILKEDYFIMDEKTNNKYLKIKELAEKLNFFIYEHEDDLGLKSTDVKYSDNLNYDECECIEIKLELNFYFYDGFDYEKINKKINKQLDKFYIFLLDAEKDSSILKNYKELWNGKYYIESNREQIKKYDYNFLF